MTATINASTTAGVVTTADTSGILQLQTNGTAALTVDASQNVGIGTSSPARKLQVHEATAATNAYIQLSNAATGATSTDGFQLIVGTGGETILAQRENAEMQFWTNNTERARIDSSGNVGIGVTPAFKLDISGSGTTAKFNTLDTYDGGASISTWQKVGRRAGTGTNAYINTVHSGSDAVSALTWAFGTSGTGTEAMRITSSGDLLVGATSPSVTSSFQVKRSGGNPVTVHNNGGTSGYFNQILFLNNAGTADIGYINRVNDSSVQYVTTSDYRLKNTVSPMTGALAKVALLKPVTYKWNADGSDGQGFIAHELAEVVPDCVSGEKDAVDDDGNPRYQGIDTSFLVATLTAAIQELKAIVDAQGAEIAALKGATA